MSQEQLFSIIRQVALVAAGGLVTKGYVDAATLNVIIGAILALGASAWAIYTRSRTGQVNAIPTILKPGETLIIKDQKLADSTGSSKVVGPAG